MLSVRTISRDEIDSWPVVESGLSVRVVNSVLTIGIRTVGELRPLSDEKLLDLRSLGRISLDHIHAFFKLCGNIEESTQHFHSIQDIFDIFLDEAEIKVLSARYGFAAEPLKASRSWATLQEIGNAEMRTRERIRQIEEVAKSKLQSRLAKVCLQPFYDLFAEFLDSHGQVSSCSDLAVLRIESALANHNPCSILLLLCDLNQGRLSFFNDFFSTISFDTLKERESTILNFLSEQTHPVSLREIQDHIGHTPLKVPFSKPAHVLSTILEHTEGIAATVDQRYFLYTRGIDAFVIEIMSSLERPVHYRTATSVFNQRMIPRCRKGAGFMLEMLNKNPRCTRVDRGHYDLKMA